MNRTPTLLFKVFFAEVVELADALRSGRSVQKTCGFKSRLRHFLSPFFSLKFH